MTLNTWYKHGNTWALLCMQTYSKLRIFILFNSKMSRRCLTWCEIFCSWSTCRVWCRTIDGVKSTECRRRCRRHSTLSMTVTEWWQAYSGAPVTAYDWRNARRQCGINFRVMTSAEVIHPLLLNHESVMSLVSWLLLMTHVTIVHLQLMITRRPRGRCWGTNAEFRWRNRRS